MARLMGMRVLTVKFLLLIYFIFLSIFFYVAIFNGIRTRKNPASEISPSIKNSTSPQTTPKQFSLSDFIRVYNNAQKIYNLDTYGPLTPSTSVIVIQTHTRLHYIDALIESLSNLHGNDDLLLIFSHDVVSPSINEKIEGIKFARVMQIFYPYSLQLFPNRFPGPDPNDNFPNGNWNASLSQIKLHWWWKLNFIFERIKTLKDFDGIISFTEEDTYFVPNALTKLKSMEEAMFGNRCGGCEVLAVGENEGAGTLNLRTGRSFLPEDLEGVVTPRMSSLHLAFNRTVWRKLKRCSRAFCEYNDYNWDWTMTHLQTSSSCLKTPLKLFLLKLPRIFHIGGCGTHYADRICDPNWHVSKAKNLSGIYGSEVPKMLGKIRISDVARWQFKPVTNFGGWGNPRVVQLCISILDSNSIQP